jgi:hypothetical protein
MLSRKRNHERFVETWKEIKAIIRRRFIHSHYYVKLYQKLKCLSRDTKSVDEYHKKIEIAMVQANVVEGIWKPL